MKNVYPIALLGDLVEVMHQGINTAADKVQYASDGVPIIQSKHFTGGALTFKDTKFLNETDAGKYKDKYIPKKNDLLFSNIGTVWKSTIVECDTKFMFAWNVFVIRVNHKKLSVRYLKHYLDRLLSIKYYEKWFTGGTVKFLNKKTMAGIEIPLPPLKEQKRIAAILDKADAIRRKRQQAIDLTDQLLRSVFLDMFGDPVTNPKGWGVIPVGEVTDCIVPGRDKPKSFSGDTSWVTTKDLEYLGVTMHPKEFIGLSDEEIKEVKAKVVPENSVLMTCVGDLGVISIAGVPMVINQQLHAFQCGKELDSQFLMFALPFQKSYMLKMASSTTVPYMNKTVCNSVPVIIPPVDLQNKFSKVAKKIWLSLILKNESENFISDLFFSLTQQAFNGQLRKPTQTA